MCMYFSGYLIFSLNIFDNDSHYVVTAPTASDDTDTIIINSIRSERAKNKRRTNYALSIVFMMPLGNIFYFVRCWSIRINGWTVCDSRIGNVIFSTIFIPYTTIGGEDITSYCR